MGYRSVVITEHTGVAIPNWFKEKWDSQFSIPSIQGELVRSEFVGLPTTPIASLRESKGHDELIEDLQKVVAEDKEWSGDCLRMVMMHEDGKVNRINIYANKVVIEAPTDWEVAEELYGY